MTNVITKEIPALSPVDEWHKLAPAARNVFIVTSFIWTFLITLVPATIFVVIDSDAFWLRLIAAVTLALSIASVAAFIAFNRWRNTFWRLDDEALYVRRGKTWFKQICLPRSRVQHLDFERGPIERRYGLATLVVHTAGTHERALRQAGLLLVDAEYLRDVLVPRDHRNEQ